VSTETTCFLGAVVVGLGATLFMGIWALFLNRAGASRLGWLDQPFGTVTLRIMAIKRRNKRIELVYCTQGRWPKQLVREEIAPGRSLGHADRKEQ
jgi:hypothetical protein